MGHGFESADGIAGSSEQHAMETGASASPTAKLHHKRKRSCGERRNWEAVPSYRRTSPESVMGDTDSRTEELLPEDARPNSVVGDPVLFFSASSAKQGSSSRDQYHACRHCGKVFATGRALGGHMRVHGSNGTANGPSRAEFSSDQIGDYSSTDYSKMLFGKFGEPEGRSADDHGDWVRTGAEEGESKEENCKDSRSTEGNRMDMDGGGHELSNGSEQKMQSLYTLRRNPKRSSRVLDQEFSVELAAKNASSRVCSQCGKEFPSSKALFGHMRCHPERDWRGIQPPADNNNTNNSGAIAPAATSGLFPAYWQSSPESEDLESPVQVSEFDCEEKREQEKASDNESDTQSMKAGKAPCRQQAFSLLNWSVTAKRGRRRPIRATQGHDNGEEEEEEEEEEEDSEELEEDKATAYSLVMLSFSAANNTNNCDTGHGFVERQMTEESVYDSKALQAGKRESQESVKDLDEEEKEDLGWKEKSIKESKKRKIDRLKPAEEGEAGGSRGEKQELVASPAETAGKYKCSTCKKVFNSHQALGGHRASHRKVKGCFAMTNINDEGQEVAEEEITEEGALLRIEYPDIANDVHCSPAKEEERANVSHLTQEESPEPATLSKKVRGHECSICHKSFPSGQALGGHKRRHWTGDRVTETASSVISTEKQPKVSCAQVRIVREQRLFDLNEPAPVEEEDLETAYDMVDVVPACAESVNHRVKMLESVTNTGFRYV